MWYWKVYANNSYFELAALEFLALIPNIDEEALKSKSSRVSKAIDKFKFFKCQKHFQCLLKN